MLESFPKAILLQIRDEETHCLNGGGNGYTSSWRIVSKLRAKRGQAKVHLHAQ